MIKTNETDTGLKASILSYRGDITYFINEIIARYKYALTILVGMSSSAKDIKAYLSRTIEDIFNTIDYIESKMPEGQSAYVDELRETAEEIRRILDTVVIPDIPDIGGDEPECGMAYERDQCQDGYCIGQPSISIGGGSECDACFDFSSGVDMCPSGWNCPGFKAGSGGCTGAFDSSGCHPFTDGFDCYSYNADEGICYGDYFVGNLCVTLYCASDFQDGDHSDCDWSFGSVTWCQNTYTQDCVVHFTSKDWEDGASDFYCEEYGVLGTQCKLYSNQHSLVGISESCESSYTNDNLSCESYGLSAANDITCEAYSDGTTTCASSYFYFSDFEKPQSCIGYNGCTAYASNEGGEICMTNYDSGDLSCEGIYGNDVSTPDCPSDFDSCSGDYTDGETYCSGYTDKNGTVDCSSGWSGDTTCSYATCSPCFGGYTPETCSQCKDSTVSSCPSHSPEPGCEQCHNSTYTTCDCHGVQPPVCSHSPCQNGYCTGIYCPGGNPGCTGPVYCTEGYCSSCHQTTVGGGDEGGSEGGSEGEGGE